MEKIVLKRKIYDKILEWKEKYAPEYALFLKGEDVSVRLQLQMNSERNNTYHIPQSAFSLPMDG